MFKNLFFFQSQKHWTDIKRHTFHSHIYHFVAEYMAFSLPNSVCTLSTLVNNVWAQIWITWTSCHAHIHSVCTRTYTLYNDAFRYIALKKPIFKVFENFQKFHPTNRRTKQDEFNSYPNQKNENMRYEMKKSCLKKPNLIC